jgi:hypothetical protein
MSVRHYRSIASTRNWGVFVEGRGFELRLFFQSRTIRSKMGPDHESRLIEIGLPFVVILLYEVPPAYRVER